MKSYWSYTSIIFAGITALLVSGVLPVFAYVMSSSNYRVDTDSVNTGGNYSQSTSYTSQDTAGEIATGMASSTSYSLSAGYQQMSVGSISISTSPDVTLPSISGLLGGESSATSTWTVITDNSAGYTLSIKATTSPALHNGISSFADYTPAGSDPDFNFSIAPTASAFGYSPEGADIVSRFKDNGSACNTGSSNTSNTCWDKFTTSNVSIASSNSPNSPSGTATSVVYKAKVGSSKIQDSGSYSASIVVTAITL
jgi:hypothetical protein